MEWNFPTRARAQTHTHTHTHTRARTHTRTRTLSAHTRTQVTHMRAHMRARAHTHTHTRAQVTLRRPPCGVVSPDSCSVPSGFHQRPRLRISTPSHWVCFLKVAARAQALGAAPEEKTRARGVAQLLARAAAHDGGAQAKKLEHEVAVDQPVRVAVVARDARLRMRGAAHLSGAGARSWPSRGSEQSVREAVVAGREGAQGGWAAIVHLPRPRHRRGPS